MGLGWKPRTGRRGLTAVALLAGALSLQSAHATVLAPGDFAAPIDQINELDFVDRVEATRDFVINVGGNPFLSGHILDRVVTLQDGTLVFETRIFVDSAPSNVGLNVQPPYSVPICMTGHSYETRPTTVGGRSKRFTRRSALSSMEWLGFALLVSRAQRSCDRACSSSMILSRSAVYRPGRYLPSAAA